MSNGSAKSEYAPSCHSPKLCLKTTTPRKEGLFCRLNIEDIYEAAVVHNQISARATWIHGQNAMVHSHVWTDTSCRLCHACNKILHKNVPCPCALSAEAVDIRILALEVDKPVRRYR
jgi:hypothetical protein